jgi:signal transduction histidine kinase
MAEQQSPICITDISPETLQSIEHQGWPELPTKAIAVPILGARDIVGKEIMIGMLVLGINPRRPFDESYEEFATMCGRQISASMITVKSIEEEAARSEELARLNRDRTLFFNTVSHELRTPLTLILGPLEECLNDLSLQQKHRSQLDMVARNGRRLLRLVNSLLDFSRVEAGKMIVSYRETDLQKYTANLASLFRSAIENGGVKYIVDMSGKEQSAWVDRDMWEVNSYVKRLIEENRI